MKAFMKFFITLSIPLILYSCGGSKKISSDTGMASPQGRLAELTKQVQKKPNDISLKRQLYKEYLNLQMEDQAVEVMEEIIAIDPSLADVQFKYGELQLRRGKSQQGYRAFLSVLQGSQAGVYESQISNYVAGKYLVQQVTSDPEDEAFPSFSPDGNRIIFQKYVSDNWDIYEYDLKAQTSSVVISSPADEELPEYSNDGSKVYYTSTAEDKRPVDSKLKVRDILVMDLADRYVTNLTQTVSDDWLPRSNISGSQILFVSERSDLRRVPYTQKHSDVFIMDKNGDFQRDLTEAPTNEGGACFSRDGKKVFFHSNRNGTYDIFVMDTDGKHVMTIIDDPQGDDVNPCASPVADEIAFFSNRDGNYEIYMANSDGTNQQRLTFHPAGDFNPEFSPDGKNIAFHSNRNGNLDIFLINLEVSTATQTTQDLISRLNELVSQ
jgi:TolB protein